MLNVKFTKEKSLIIKGLAILMMMWHHCFLSGRYDGYSISFWPLAEYQVNNIASFCKVCVSLFAFVSGYGLYKSYNQDNLMNNNKWVKNRLVRTLSGYWFVVILSWVICWIIDKRPVNVYGIKDSIIYGTWNMIIEFLGLSNLFGKTPMNGTWWYMSAAIAFILLTPMFFRLLRKLGGVCMIGMVFILPRAFGGYPGNIHFFSFVPIFCLGMIFANYDFFEIWGIFWKKKEFSLFAHIVKFVIMVFLLICSYKLYYYLPDELFWDIKWGVIPIVWILFINDYLSEIPVIQSILRFIGKHSTNVFLVHTFFRYYYGENIIYNLKHFMIVILVLLVVSLVSSVIIEWLKKIVRYEKLIDKIF